MESILDIHFIFLYNKNTESILSIKEDDFATYVIKHSNMKGGADEKPIGRITEKTWN